MSRRKATNSLRETLKPSAGDFALRRTQSSAFLALYTIDLESPLYKGEFAEVYACIHKETRQERAVKIVRETSSKCHEFNVLKRLDHPGVVKVYELFCEDCQYYIVMERLRGGTLSDALSKAGTSWSEADAKVVMIKLLACFNYLRREKHLVHCDVRPRNFMLARPDDLTSIKVIDFDMATFLKKKGDKIKCKKDCKNLPYQAPEVVQFRPSYDCKADVWSLGVLLYRMMFHRLPFAADPNDECCTVKDTYSDEETLLITTNIMRGNLHFPDQRWRDDPISSECIKMIKKMLTVDPEKRVNAAKALANNSWLMAGQYQRDQLKLSGDSAHSIIQILSNVRKFHATTKLKQAVVALIASQLLEPEELGKIDHVFSALDVAGDGKIRPHEFQAGYLLAFNIMLSSAEVEEIFRKVDSNKSGTIEYSEFGQ